MLPASVYRRDQRNAGKIRQSEEEDNRRRRAGQEDEISKHERERKAKLEAALARTAEENANAVEEQRALEATNAGLRARAQRDYSRYLAYAKRSPVFAIETVGPKTPATHDAIDEKYSLGHQVEFAKCGHHYCVQTGSDLHKQIDTMIETSDHTWPPVDQLRFVVVRPGVDDATWERLEKRYRDHVFVTSNTGCRFCAKWLAQARDPPPTVFDVSPYDRVAEIYFAVTGECPWRLNREDSNKWYEVNHDLTAYWFAGLPEVYEQRRRLARDNFYNFMYGENRLPLSFLEWAGVVGGKITLEQVAEQREVDVKHLLRPRF